MNRLFFRIFPLALLASMAATVALCFAINHLFGAPLEEIARKQASGSFFLLMKMAALHFVVVALFLLIPIAMWSRSHWRDLQALSKVAEAFGAGKLSVRADIEETASVYPLAQCMNQMADQIQGLLDAQRTLLHSVSHELRTPIARIEFGLTLLYKKVVQDEGLTARFVSLEADVAELSSLVGELLSLARLDQKQSTQFSRFALADLLQHAVNGLEHMFIGKQVECRFDDGMEDIIGDQRLIGRAVSNLLINAAKYTSQRIAVSAISGDDHIEIVVDDDGPGIPIEEREAVFEPFHRLDRSHDRATDGFGLGLAIARKVVQLHGGSIVTGDSPLGGARFTICLPSGVWQIRREKEKVGLAGFEPATNRL